MWRCVYEYVCVHVFSPTWVHMYVLPRASQHTHTHTLILKLMSQTIATGIQIHTHNMVCICTCGCVSVCMYMWLRICICIYTYMCIYLYVYSYKSVYTHMRGHRICLNHRSKNTGFGLRVFLALSNRSVFFFSMTCSSKTLRQILLVTFSARLTWSRHICSTLHHIFGCLLFLKFG